jgi:predicted neuraminidase
MIQVNGASLLFGLAISTSPSYDESIMFRSAFLLNTLLPVVAALSTIADDFPGLVSTEFLAEKFPFRECHASTLVETPDGLVCAMFGGSSEGNDDVGIWVALHREGRWSTAEEVANGIQYLAPDGKPGSRHPCWNPVLFRPSSAGAPLLLFYKCGPSPSTWWGMLATSPDNGKTWDQPCRLPEGIDGPVKNKPIELADGTLLCGSSTESKGWRLHLEMTRDLGITWTRVGPLHDGKDKGAIQPSILTHPDGRLQILCRNYNGNDGDLWTCSSRDGGFTWTPLESTGLPNPNSGTDALTLSDGRHLLVYNHTNRKGTPPLGRSMLNIAVSEDGRTWRAATILERRDGAEFSYPAVIQTNDGLVHITYTWDRKRIRHTILDPTKLELSDPIKDRLWPSFPSHAR